MTHFLMHYDFLNEKKKHRKKNGEFVTPLHCACKEHEKTFSDWVLHGTASNRKGCK